MAPALAPALVGVVRWHDASGVPGRGSLMAIPPLPECLPLWSLRFVELGILQWTVNSFHGWFLIGFYFLQFETVWAEYGRLTPLRGQHDETFPLKTCRLQCRSVAGQSCIPLVWLCISQHTKRLPCLVWRLQGDQVGFGITVVPLRVDISWSFFAEVEPIESIWWFCTRLKSSDLTKFLLLLDFCEISTCSKVRVPTNLTLMPGCQSCRTCTASLMLLGS